MIAGACSQPASSAGSSALVVPRRLSPEHAWDKVGNKTPWLEKENGTVSKIYWFVQAQTDVENVDNYNNE